MSPKDIHEILSGERTGLSAGLMRFGLAMLEPIYTIGASFLRFLYNMRLRPIHHVSRPVISVGNITTGGTGKTPFTALLVQKLQQQGHHPGIASRGYKSQTGPHPHEAADVDDDGEDEIDVVVSAGNDEKLMLDQICPGVPHLQDRDRVLIAQKLIREFSCDRILLDDGFQHRRLQRELDLVLIDAANPFGYGHLLPRGLLREPLTSLERAGMIVITRADQVSQETLQQIRETLGFFTKAPVIEVCFRATGWLETDGRKTSLEDKPVNPILFCGIGNPQNFRDQLKALDVVVNEENWKPFPDHHHYTSEEIRQLCEQAKSVQGELLTTHKDLVKVAQLLPELALDQVRCRALMIEAVISSGEHLLDEKLAELK